MKFEVEVIWGKQRTTRVVHISNREAYKVKKFQVLTVLLVVGLLFGSVVSANTIDLGGKTITIVGGVDKLESQRKSGLVAEAEALFNVKIETLVVPADQAVETMVTRLISGDAEYD